ASQEEARDDTADAALFVTGVGASSTYPDYKPAPFIVASKLDDVDMVTVVTEGIFSYCSFKVKIDTDRFLGPEQANVRCQGEIVGHVTTAEYGSQMLSVGGVHHLTGGSKKEGRVTCGMTRSGIKIRGRKSTPGRYFQVANPGIGWGGTDIQDPLAIIEGFDPAVAQPGMRLLMVSTTGEHAQWYELDHELVPRVAAMPD